MDRLTRLMVLVTPEVNSIHERKLGLMRVEFPEKWTPIAAIPWDETLAKFFEISKDTAVLNMYISALQTLTIQDSNEKLILGVLSSLRAHKIVDLKGKAFVRRYQQ